MARMAKPSATDAITERPAGKAGDNRKRDQDCGPEPSRAGDADRRGMGCQCCIR